MASSRAVLTNRTFFSANAAIRQSTQQTSFGQFRHGGKNSWQKQQQRAYGSRFQRRDGYQYSRFQQAGGLLTRWAARPTFYYEVGGLAGACGGFYIYNLEVVPVSDFNRSLSGIQNQTFEMILAIGA